jgi:c(7)-type cytochrome triheme protein
MMRTISLCITVLLLLFHVPARASDSVWWTLPELPAPELYGNILIDRTSSGAGMKAVGFSHWSHRVRYTCKVCHFELEFNMRVNTTDITEEQNRYGRYCGACHNGTIAFGHGKEHCHTCHSGNIANGREKFSTLSGLPKAVNGNGIDWVKAVREKVIKPENYVLEKLEPLRFDREVVIESPWAGIAPAVFPHDEHGRWLYCSNCHPEIFQIREYATENLAMESILDYEFCGVCHGRVAFPPNDNCKRCHPKMKNPGKTGSQKHQVGHKEDKP